MQILSMPAPLTASLFDVLVILDVAAPLGLPGFTAVFLAPRRVAKFLAPARVAKFSETRRKGS